MAWQINAMHGAITNDHCRFTSVQANLYGIFVWIFEINEWTAQLGFNAFWFAVFMVWFKMAGEHDDRERRERFWNGHAEHFNPQFVHFECE